MALDLNPVYNYYSSTVYNATQTKYDSHKTSDLKKVYNNMVKNNTKSPLFKVKVNEKMQDYAIGLKSAAIGLQNFSELLSDKEEDTFSKLMATSEDPSVVTGSIITTDYSALPGSLDIDVEQLATTQINTGFNVSNNDLDIEPGAYSFTIKTDGRSYGFNLKVRDEDTNLAVEQRLSDFINKSNVGIDARVESGNGLSRLILESEDTGTDDTIEGRLFSISDGYGKSTGLVETFGLDNVTQYPDNAIISLNGNRTESSSNDIAVNRMIEIELNSVSNGPVRLDFVPDTDDIVGKLKSFADSYNKVIDIANDNADSERGAKKLLHEVQGIASRHQSALEAVGLGVDESGHMVPDDALLSQSVSNGSATELFSDLSGFKEDIMDKTEDISLDPMSYVDKTVITYPNPARTFSNPYMPSMYSGMLYNYYV
ncbi:MAG: flagellar filament capping protein FliD [Lachnospiraceae bacterium]|nr:flagellar filament capping protein FliD [Lachnospiraceae bacterium]